MMHFQAILLCVVILFSLFAAPLFQPSVQPVNKAKEIAVESSPAGDLYSGFFEKFSAAKEARTFGKFNLFNGQAAAVITGLISGDTETEARETGGEGLPEANNNFVPDPDAAAFLCDSINPDEMDAKEVLVKYQNPSSGSVVFELNSKKRWPIASLSKLMTGVIAAEKIGWNREVIMSEKAVNSEGVAGGFSAGEIFSVGDLIKAMLMVSSNDAAVAIAETLGENEFVDAMQSKASELKMLQTTYLEPSGLSFINQSTASDLAKLIGYIYQNHPELLEISRQKETTITELKTRRARTLININHFAGQPDFIGGKTGYIDEAGRNLASLFNVNGRIFLIVVLGSDDAFKTTNKLKQCIQPTSF